MAWRRTMGTDTCTARPVKPVASTMPNADRWARMTGNNRRNHPLVESGSTVACGAAVVPVGVM